MSISKNQLHGTALPYRPQKTRLLPKSHKHTIKRHFVYCAVTLTAAFSVFSNKASADLIVDSAAERDRTINQIKASHFLSQATFGPTWSQINDLADEIESLGETRALNNWITEQFNIAPTLVNDELVRLVEDTGRDIRSDLDVNTRGFQGPSPYRDYAVWDRKLTAPDQLRQRMSYALSQILVVGDSNVLRNRIGWRGTSIYNDLLLNNAFGNYRNLLEGIVYSPAMGEWLDSAGNQRTSVNQATQLTRFPDENFAREFLQLFTVGVFRLNDAGQVLNNSGTPISGARDTPAELYTNETIQEFARVFTGLNYSNFPGGNTSFENRFFYFLEPMVMDNRFHEPGRKTLLDGFRTPGGAANGERDIDLAIDNAFNHSNCPPFISRLLIQRFTTSNPSTDYVSEVVRIFRGPGTTARGNLRRVLRTILMHPEARDSLEITSTPEGGGRWRINVSINDRLHGKLREPFIQLTSMLRAFEVRSRDTNVPGSFRFRNSTGELGQFPLDADSVFNFYLPDHQPVGRLQRNNIVGPEFEIFTPTRIHSLANIIRNTMNNEGVNANRRVFTHPFGRAGAADIRVASVLNRISNADSVLNYLNILFCQGTISENALAGYRDVLNSSISDAEKASILVSTILSSPSFAVSN